MIKAGSSVHFREPGISNQRILFHTTVQGADEDSHWIATFTEGHPNIAVDQDVLIYFEVKREFMQQPSHIHALEEGEEGLVVTFEPMGDPVSAENRQNYRVSTITADIGARLGSESDCKVVDISSTGFAAVTSKQMEIGETIDTVIHFEGRTCNGIASVQSVREKPGGDFRHGFLSVSHKDGGAFQEALNEVSLEVQRSQLRRLSGAG